MKIIFNLQGVGLANNGGSSTIVRSANVLASLGHEVYVVSEKKNELTWVALNGPTYIKTDGLVCTYPSAHAIIATGVHSVQHVLNASARVGKKYWWIRAHETWAMKEADILKLYSNLHIKPIVNSVCLKNFILKKLNKDLPIVRPGVDPTVFYQTNGRNWNKKEFVLGGLYCDKPRKRMQWIVEIYEACKQRKLSVKLHLFGTYDEPKDTMHDKYVKTPDSQRLRDFYNEVDIWLAPSESEGLHIPPQEAMLCGCVVIGANEPLSGMKDYLFESNAIAGTTGYYMKHWSDAVDIIENWYTDRDTMAEISANGRKQILKLGDRFDNMKLFVNTLKKIGEDPLTLKRRELELKRRGR